jgi:hypothetical protein
MEGLLPTSMRAWSSRILAWNKLFFDIAAVYEELGARAHRHAHAHARAEHNTHGYVSRSLKNELFIITIIIITQLVLQCRHALIHT